MGVTSNSSKPAQSNLVAVIGASVGGVLLLVLIIAGVCFGYRRYHREATQETIPFANFGPRQSGNSYSLFIFVYFSRNPCVKVRGQYNSESLVVKGFYTRV